MMDYWEEKIGNGGHVLAQKLTSMKEMIIPFKHLNNNGIDQYG
jgi:hypothetical protein